jgi:hypothetical protein
MGELDEKAGVITGAGSGRAEQDTAREVGDKVVPVHCLAAFLCSDRASYFNGAIIPVTGGYGIRFA